MKKVYLTAMTDPETGELGLVIEGVHIDGQPLVAAEGLVIAHDIIEHQNGLRAIGPIDDELEALGAIWFVRGQWGDLRRDGSGSAISTEGHIASDVTRMFRDYALGDAPPSTAPRTTECEADDTFRCIIDIAQKDFDGEVYRDEPDARKLEAGYLRECLARMRIGYRKAKRRFPVHFAANNQFWAIADAVDPHAKHVEYEGQRFALTWGGGEAQCTQIYEEE